MKGLVSQKWVIFALTIFLIFQHVHEIDTQPISHPHVPELFCNQTSQKHQKEIQETHKGDINIGLHTILTGLLCFSAASISSIGGLGGGGLFLPILNLVANLDLKTATAFTAFMVTGGSVANVLYSLCKKNPMFGNRPLIDYDIALLSQPCMLLGVSVGVICNVVFPEWLITLLFAVFLLLSTFKTCKTGFLYRKVESDGVREEGLCKKENGLERDGCCGEGNGEMGMKEPLLGVKRDGGISAIPLKKLGVLVMIWVSFFVVHVLRGNRLGQSLIEMEPCGTGYWLLLSLQIALALIFTVLVLRLKDSPQHQNHNQQEVEPPCQLTFPLMALASGILGGLFGIGGGMLINPVMLQIGVPPQITAATCSFMVLFSSSMSSVQYLMLGMKHVNQALIFAAGCFLASLLGLAMVQRAIGKHGRASLIVFSVGVVMALSTALITSFGALDVWKDYKSGQYMGFSTPC